jgi:transketolase
MALAPLGYHLYMEVMRHNPRDPGWHDRDRFILSCGHASMLQYALLHMTGYDLSLEDLKNFRQWGSKTAGHPELHHTPGVEITTGPLGQGISSGVGFALAEQMMAAEFNTGGHRIVGHHTYVICSDGDLMEGVASEAASLAGHWGLGKLICYFDNNSITIDGGTELSFTEDVGARFRAYGWQTLVVEDVTDLDALRVATEAAQAESSRPTLILVTTVIGHGSPHKAGTSAAHGAPLGVEEIVLSKRALGWPEDAHFLVPDEAREDMLRAVPKGAAAQSAWTERFARYRADHPEKAAEFVRRMTGQLPEGWDVDLPSFAAGESVATRKSSHAVLRALMARVPELAGGSADLAGSNGTQVPEFGEFTREDRSGRMLHFGVREHGMAAVCNGLSLHGGVRPFCATFLIFADYLRPSLRLGALMGLPVVYVLTHDSIGLGQDGPTHQPVAVLASLRAIPNVHVYRPGDAGETVEAWKSILRRTEGPSVLVLTRQGVPTLAEDTSGASRGAYVVQDTPGSPDCILMGTGSELQLAMGAADILASQGVNARVVSVPCRRLFMEQSEAYREAVLPRSVRARVAVEAACSFGWYELVGLDGTVVCLDRFGASAPAPVLFEQFGFTAQNVAERARSLVGDHS